MLTSRSPRTRLAALTAALFIAAAPAALAPATALADPEPPAPECPFRITTPPAVDASEVPKPGEPEPSPLAVPAKFPYHPHVTVAHAVDDARLDAAFEQMAGFDATFHVTSFDGYVQTPDCVWHLRRSYPLG